MDESPDRRAWLDKLLAFMDDRRTPITTCPTISKNPLDLFRLYVYVKERGGFMEVCTCLGVFSATTVMTCMDYSFSVLFNTFSIVVLVQPVLFKC